MPGRTRSATNPPGVDRRMSEAVEPSGGKRKQTQDHISPEAIVVTVTLIPEAGSSPSASTGIRHPDRPGMSLGVGQAHTSSTPVRLRRPPASEPPYDLASPGGSTPARRTATAIDPRPAHGSANVPSPTPGVARADVAAGRCRRGRCREGRCREGRCRSDRRRRGRHGSDRPSAAGGPKRTALCPHLPGGSQRLPPRQSPAHSRRTGRVQHGRQPVEPAAQRSRPLHPVARCCGDGNASQQSRRPATRDPTQRWPDGRCVLADDRRRRPIWRASVNRAT